MRVALILIVSLIVSAPALSSAQGTNPPATLPEKCPKGGSTGNPTETRVFLNDGTSNATVVNDYLQRKTSCPNACYDIKITITQTKAKNAAGVEVDGLSYKTTVIKNWCTDTAKLPKDQPTPMGCATGQRQPQVTAITPRLGNDSITVLEARTVGPKSRCKGDFAEAAGPLIEGFGAKCTGMGDYLSGKCATAASSVYAGVDQYNASSDQAVPIPDTASTEAPVPNSTEALTQMLQDKYNVSAEDAKRVATENPDRLKELLEKSSTNDTAGVQAIAKDLRLNPELFSSQASIAPPNQTAQQEALAAYQAQQRETSTFAQRTDMDRAKQAIANIESSGGKYDMLGPVTNRGDRAYGKYQVMGVNVGPWTQAALGYRMSPEELRADPQAQEKVFEHRFGGYAQKYGWEGAARAWFAGEGGMYSNRSDQLGTSVSRYATRFNGYFENGQILGGGSRYSSGGGSAFGGITSGNYPTSVSFPTGGTNYSGGSAFSTANPFYYDGNSSSNYGYQPYTQSSPTNSILSFFTGLFRGSSSAQSNPTIQQMPTQASPIQQQQQQQQAVVTLIAQPQQAFVGNHIVLSWSSVGMRTNVPCITQLFTKSGTSTIATANEGSKIITASSAGLMRFSIACVSLSGTTITQATAVAVQ